MENIVSFCKDWFQEYRPEPTLFNQILWIFWAVWVLLIFVAVCRVIRFRLNLRKELKIWGDGSGPQKTAVVIVPIKGVTPSHTSDFFQSLLEQNYSKYRIIVTVESSDDPAAEWLSEQFGLSLSSPVWAPESRSESGLQMLQLVIAGKCKGCGQKVQNQLAAFDELVSDDEIIAFVDADIICPPDWLAKLTAPINRGTHDPATTYRWLVPAKFSSANLFASVINASVTTQGGNVRENMPWGGSMAISRATFDHLNLPVLFAGSVNDDLRLGKAAKKAGYKVGYIRNLVRPSEIDFTWPKFIEFARRQYLQVKIFAPILYCSGNLIFAIYFLGFVSVAASIALGNLWGWVPLIIATLLDQVRATTRESIYRNLFGDDRRTYRQIAKTSGIEHFLTPLYMSIHGLIIMSTWFMNKMEWGGVRYQIEGVDKTRVLNRVSIKSSVSLSSVGQLALPAGGVFAGLAAANAFAMEVAQNPPLEPVEDTLIEDVVEHTVTVEETETISVSDAEVEIETVEEEAAVVEGISETTVDPEVPDSDDESKFFTFEKLGGATVVGSAIAASIDSSDDSEVDIAPMVPVGATEFVVELFTPETEVESPVEIETPEVVEVESVESEEVVINDIVVSVPVSAVRGVVSAVRPLGIGATAPPKTRIAKLERSHWTRKKKVAKTRHYLAKWDHLSRQ